MNDIDYQGKAKKEVCREGKQSVDLPIVLLGLVLRVYVLHHLGMLLLCAFFC